MGTMRVQWIGAGPLGEAPVLTGTLTTEHSASSYGLPVVVGEDGTVYGPAEIGDRLLPIDDARSDDWQREGSPEDALMAAAAKAGYTIEDGSILYAPGRLVLCTGCGEEIGADERTTTWHNGSAYCQGCEDAPAEDENAR